MVKMDIQINKQLLQKAKTQNVKYFYDSIFVKSFPGGSEGKESACNAGDPGSIPGLGRSPGGGHGDPLQYSCLENPMEEEPGELQTNTLHAF